MPRCFPSYVTCWRRFVDWSAEGIGDKAWCRAADSDPLRQRLALRGIELICPHCRGRVRPATQDGRPLRRFRRRWIVERTIGWLQTFRRLVTRYEFYSFLFHSFAKLACMMIVLRRF
jgi:transposase